jgi:Terpene cyclase DEP1
MTRQKLKRVYAGLAVVGYLSANWFVLQVSIDTGNVLLWTRPLETMAGMFANRIATAFAVDLLITALVACIWFHVEGKRLSMRRVWGYWLLTLTFGLAGTLPLFLLHRERRLELLESTPRNA